MSRPERRRRRHPRARRTSSPLRRHGGTRRPELRGRGGPALRLRRPQRRGQDDRDADRSRRPGAGRRRGPLEGPAGRRGGSRAATARWLERLGLAEVADRRTETLSLGNQQRAQLGAALVHDPELLVLDEPFSGLDPVGVDVLIEVLRERARAGVPVVFSSHQLELVERLCDAVAIVRDGRVVASGRVADLRAHRGGRRWRVEVAGAAPGWLEAVAGAELVLSDNGAVVVELGDGANEQALLDAARRAGRVRRFAPEEPSLAQLFREAVA